MLNDPCPTSNQLSEYVLGLIDDATSEVLDEHLVTCKCCQDTLAGIRLDDDTFVSRLKTGITKGEFDHEPTLANVLNHINSEMLSRPLVDGNAALTKADNPRNIASGGTTLGPYRLLKLLGEGGMGQVYLAQHSRLEMVVAVKVLAEHLNHNPQAISRFDREMKAVGRFNHPNIVRATDAGEYHGQHYLAMEFVDGRDLFQIVNAYGRLKVCDACEVVRQAAIGIQHAHEHDLIHRDLKPSNLMVTKDGLVKVLDLGLARLQTKSDDGLTADFQVMGTADYMAPEQALKALEVDFKADIYSLGCTLYALLCGQPPFADKQHSTSLRKIIAHEQEQPIQVHVRRAEIPIGLSKIADKAMAKLPSERFATAGDFATALQPFADGADLVSLYAQSPSTVVDAAEIDTADISPQLATADTQTSTSRKQKIADVQPKNVLLTWRPLALLLLVGIVALSSLIVLFNTANGTIIIEIQGGQIQASLEGEKVVIEDKARKTIYHLSIAGEKTQTPLSPGTYTIRVENEASGLTFETQEFKIARNDVTVVKAFIEQPGARASLPSELTKPNATAPAIELTAQAAAQWGIKNQAIVSIESEHGYQFVNSIEELPGGSFRVVAFNFTKPADWTEADFELIGRIGTINHLEFQDLDLTDRVTNRLSTLPNLVTVRLRYDESKPRNLEQLDRLPHLYDLTLGGAYVGDAEVEMLRGLKNVRSLTVSGTEVTDTALQYIGEMEQLTFLSLTFAKVNGSGIIHLQKLKNLWSLHLPYTLTNDAGLAAIGGLQNLTWLNLGFSKVGDRCIDSIVDLKKLEVLELSDGAITGSGLEKLKGIASLRKLDLQGTLITDADVEHLGSMTQLSALLIGDRLSSVAVARLQEKLPNCDINSTSQSPVIPRESLDRTVAKAMIARGARVHVRIGNQFQNASTVGDLPSQPFQISRVEFTSPYELTDEDFESLASLQALTAMDLCEVAITERVIAYLQQLQKLELLWMKYNNGPVAGMERIVQLPRTYNLKLQGSAVGDKEIEAMSQLRRVRYLSLSGRGFTDECLPFVAKIAEIAGLSIENSSITGSGLEHLSRLPILASLHLPGSFVSNEQLKGLATLKSLKELNLSNSKITDGAVDVLGELTQLNVLMVGSNLTAEGASRLRSLLPNCKIVSAN